MSQMTLIEGEGLNPTMTQVKAVGFNTAATGGLHWSPLGIDSGGVAKYRDNSTPSLVLRPTITVSLKEVGKYDSINGKTVAKTVYVQPKEYTLNGIDYMASCRIFLTVEAPFAATDDEVAAALGNFLTTLMLPCGIRDVMLSRDSLY